MTPTTIQNSSRGEEDGDDDEALLVELRKLAEQAQEFAST
jgi:hypothetical protein